MADFEVVASLHELSEGVPKLVVVRGRELLLLRWRDEVVALRNICPHQLQPLQAGSVRPYASSSVPGEVVMDSADPVLVCPVHGWQYRLRDGQCPHDPRMRIRKYEVAINEGQISVAVGR